MSDKVLAIVPHSFTSIGEVLTVPELFKPLADLAHRVNCLYGEREVVEAMSWTWTWYQDEATPEEDWTKYHCAWFEGPMTIAVGTRCLFVQTQAKWHVARAREPLLRAAETLFDAAAMTLGTEQYVCAHDNHAWDPVLDGLNLEQTLRMLDALGYQRVSSMSELALPPDYTEEQYVHNLYCWMHIQRG